MSEIEAMMRRTEDASSLVSELDEELVAYWKRLFEEYPLAKWTVLHAWNQHMTKEKPKSAT